MVIKTIVGASGTDSTTLLGSESADSFTVVDNNVYVDSLQGNDTVIANSGVEKLTIEADEDDDTIF